MKTKKNPFLRPSLPIHALALAAAALACGQASATTYRWLGATSGDWNTASNWLSSQIAPTNTSAGHRLDINNGANNEAVYTAALGTTVYGATGVRGLVIGSGSSNGDGTLRITGGTFSTAGNATVDTSFSDIIGNQSPRTGTLIIDGGTYITGVNGVRLGINADCTANLNVKSGSMNAAYVALNATTSTVNFDGGTATIGSITRGTGTATVNFNGGTLQARQNAGNFVSGTISTKVLAGGAVIDTNGFNVTISTALVDGGGGGGLTVNGTGTLHLSGANTYTGTTTINGGILYIDNNATLGAGNIVNNATLSLNRTTAFTLNNTISGTGGLQFNNTGVVNLGGTNTYTGPTAIDKGTVYLNGSLTSDVSVAGGAHLGGEGSTTGSITFNGTSNLTFSPSTAATLTAASVDASAATVSFIPTGAPGPLSNVVVMEAAGGISGVIGTNFLGNSRISLAYNGGNTQLLANYTPGSLVWKGDQTSDWDSMATPNWTNTATSAADQFYPGDAVLFNDDNELGSTVFVNLQGALAPGAVVFDNTDKTYDLMGISGGAITGNTSVTMNGEGGIILNTDNSYSGGTVINSGTVEAKAFGALGSGAVTVETAATLDLTNAAAGSGTQSGLSTALSGGGTVNVTLGNYDASRNFNGNNSNFTGTLNIGIGAIAGELAAGIQNGKARIDSALHSTATVNVLEHASVYVGNATTPVTQPAALVLNGGDTGELLGQLRLDYGCTWSGPLTLAGDITGTGDGNIGSYSGRSGNITGNIGESGGPRALVKAGGGYITLTGNNTYTGETRIIAGALVAASPNALGGTDAGTIVTANSSIGLSGGGAIPAAETLTITGPGTDSNGVFAANQRGALQSVSGSNTWAGDITVAGTSANNRIGVQDGAQLTVSGTITESDAGRTMVFRHGQTAGSNLTVSGTGNYWTGETQIIGGAGAVILGADNAFPAVSHLRVGTSGVDGQTTLDLNGFSQTCNGLSRVAAGPGFITNHGAATSTLAIDSATDLNWGGVIENGSSPIAVIKTGTSIQTFSGTNTYTGATTVNGGTLHVTGQLAAGSAVTVGGAAATGSPTLSGSNGFVNGPVTISAANGGAAGTISPGTVGTIGTLNTGAAVIAGTYACDINDTAVDLLNVSGNLDLTGSVLALNELAAPAAASYTLAIYSGTLTGTFTPTPALPAGYTLDYATPGVIKLVSSTSGSAFDSWIAAAFPGETDPAVIGAGADPDGDGASNLAEFAFHGNPASPASHGMVHSFAADSDADGDALKELVLTIAVRAGAPAFSGNPLAASIDGIDYTVEGGTTLGSFTGTVNIVPTPVTTNLPASPGAGYEWRSFTLGGSNGLAGRGFMRAKVQQP